MISIVGQKNRVVGAHRGAMSALENILTPGMQEISFAVKNNDRMRPPRETVNAIFLIHRHCRNFLEGPSIGQLAPPFDDFVAKIPTANSYSHKDPYFTSDSRSPLRILSFLIFNF
jgi:hypothetical protein